MTGNANTKARVLASNQTKEAANTMSATTGPSRMLTGGAKAADAPAAILPASKATLRTVALTARIVLLPAALLATIAAFTDRPMEGGLVEAAVVVGALAVGTLAGVGLYAPQSRLDLGAVVMAMLLAGGQAVQGFGFVAESYGSYAYALPIVAWLALFGGALALALTIPLGAAEASSSSLPWPSAVAAPAPSSAGAGSQAPAGWYPSPDGTFARWWDGQAWTEHHRDMSEFDAHKTSAACGNQRA